MQRSRVEGRPAGSVSPLSCTLMPCLIAPASCSDYQGSLPALLARLPRTAQPINRPPKCRLDPPESRKRGGLHDECGSTNSRAHVISVRHVLRKCTRIDVTANCKFPGKSALVSFQVCSLYSNPIAMQTSIEHTCSIYATGDCRPQWAVLTRGSKAIWRDRWLETQSSCTLRRVPSRNMTTAAPGGVL